MLQLRFDLQT